MRDYYIHRIFLTDNRGICNLSFDGMGGCRGWAKIKLFSHHRLFFMKYSPLWGGGVGEANMLILKKTHPEWFMYGLRMLDGFY
jgi:hypothetical protein